MTTIKKSKLTIKTIITHSGIILIINLLICFINY